MSALNIDKLLGIDYVVLSIPAFLFLIAVDCAYSYLKRKKDYSFGDTLGNLSTGSLMSITANLTKGGMVAVYSSLYSHFALIDMTRFSTSMKWAAGITLFVTLDFLYYWFHRFAHRTNLGWIGHSVHHQSEKYNLAVALRQGALQTPMSSVFFLPLAFVGFPPLWLISMYSAVTAYQFWIHTEHVKTLGPMEWIFNTPSHHRVHHGVNKKYQDKNYAGVFIIWDRLFGTFEPEDFKVIYGTTAQLNSWSPIQAHLQHIEATWSLSKKATSLWDKIKVWWAPPEWRPRNLESFQFPSDEEFNHRTKYATSVPYNKFVYAFIAFFVGLVFSVIAINMAAVRPSLAPIILGIVATVAYVYSSSTLEKRAALSSDPLKQKLSS